MRYQMMQRLFAIGDKGVITDEQGTVVYRNNGSFLSLRDKVALVDVNGVQVASLHSKLSEFPKALHIEIGGKDAAKVVRKFLSFRLTFDIRLATGERWKLNGKWTNHAFTLNDHRGQTIATISRDWVTLTDGYGIDIADDQDDLLILMILVALETAAADDRDSSFDSF